jgi:RNA polymerase sigma factor, sigma-70 family
MKDLSLRADDSIETVIQENALTVYKLAYARMRNRSDAEDVFQEVFLRLVRRRPVFENKEHEKAWLIRVTLNCFNNLWNMPFRKNTQSLDESIPCDLPEENCMKMLLDELPKDYRVIIHLYYYEEMTTAQISTVLKRKEATIRVYLTRARRRLRELLEGDEDFV